MTATVSQVGAGADAGDAYDVLRVRAAPPLLREFNEAGVLAPADVHVATTLGRLAGEEDERVLLALALAVRAPRLQHVCVDLATVDASVTADGEAPVDAGALPWPERDGWLAAVGTSPLVGLGETARTVAAVGASPLVGPGEAAGRVTMPASGRSADGGDRPLRLAGSLLYLDRYWRYEQRVLAALRHRSARPAADVDHAVLRQGLDRLFPPLEGEVGADQQRIAAAVAVLRRFAVIAGGPGTGKTTTAARVLVLLEEQAAAAGQRPPRVALVAPTGKAATRLEESVAQSAADLATNDDIRARLSSAEASTIHRLLGNRWRGGARFRHDREKPLPHEVVVVDEASMVSLSLMARLLGAVRLDARVVLLGDPEQLTSVEAGAVLGDIVGPVTTRARMSADARRVVEQVTGQRVETGAPLEETTGQRTETGAPLEQVTGPGMGAGGPLEGSGADSVPRAACVADGIVVLRRVHRFLADSGIAALAAAIQAGDAPRAEEVLSSGRSDVRWIAAETGGVDSAADELAPVRAAVTAVARRVSAAAHGGDAVGALHALQALRLLCAHRRGPFGVETWVPAVERWLAAAGVSAAEQWHVGRPVLVTENDYQLGLYNGDTGVVVARPDGKAAVAFEDGDGVRFVSPTRLETVETVHAMTVHKSQGSQFREVVVVLPPPDSPILTRELLYTAVTRARERLTVVGSSAAVRAAVGRRVQRASGLRAALWGE